MSGCIAKVTRGERLREILSGGSKQGTPVIAQAALMEVAFPMKESIMRIYKSGNSIVALVLIVSALLLFSAQQIFFSFSIDPEFSLAASLGSAIFIALGISFYLDKKAELFVTAKSSLEAPYQELVSTRDWLTRNLKRLDARTTRYFHCITQTKVTSVFLLMQLERALSRRIDSICVLLNKGDHASLVEAFELLQGGVLVEDGAIQGSGDAHVIPLSGLNDAIAALVEEVEKGISELEAKIREIQSTYRPAESKEGSARIISGAFEY